MTVAAMATQSGSGSSTHMITCIAGVILCLLASSESAFSFPWGPYVVPRSAKRSGVEKAVISGNELPNPTCCPYGLKSGYTYDENGDEILLFNCPRLTPCCLGLYEVMRTTTTGRDYYACVPGTRPNGDDDNFLGLSRG